MSTPPPNPDGTSAKSERPAHAPPTAHSLAEDWVTIWQSELNAAATDPELIKLWQIAVSLWATSARNALALLAAPPHEHPHASARAEPPPRPPPAAAAPDARDAAIEQLAKRVAELERKFAHRDPA